VVFWLKGRGARNAIVLQAIALLEKASRNEKKGIWKDLAARLGKPRRRRVTVNLWKIDRASKKLGKRFLVVPGKVLALGELSTPVNVVALEFSEAAEKKINDKGRALTIAGALKEKINPKDTAIVC
jgi:large subunit ribosomal protein L18e